MFIIYPNGDMLNTRHIKKIYANQERKYNKVLGDYVWVKPTKVIIEYISHKGYMDTDELCLDSISAYMCYEVTDIDEFISYLHNEIKGLN